MNKKVVLIFFICVMLFALAGCGEPEMTKDTITAEAGDELKLNASDFFDTSEKKLEKISFDTSKVDVNIPGSYSVKAVYGKEEYTIKVKVEDTKEPAVEMGQSYIFTNDYKAFDYSTIINSIDDVTECTVSLNGLQKVDAELTIIDDQKITELTETLIQENEIEAITSLDSSEDGIYDGVLKISDTSGNSTYKEIIIFYDTTAPVIENLEDFTVEQEDETVSPEVDFSKYTVTDTFDGTIATENVQTSIELTDEENHQYTISVTAADRAGNIAEGSCLLTVEKKKEKNTAKSSNGSDSSSTAATELSGAAQWESIVGNSSEYDGEGNWHKKEHGFSYGNEVVGRYCIYLDGAHHEVSKEVAEAAGNAYFVASGETQTCAYAYDNGDGTVTVHSAGETLPYDMSREEYSNILNQEFLNTVKYYNSHEEFVAANDAYIRDAVAAVIYQ